MDLKNYTLVELRQLAKEAGEKNVSKLSKEDLRYINLVDIIEDTKKRLKANSNYDMCIDNLLFNIWYLFQK